jgi:hypothetical protein
MLRNEMEEESRGLISHHNAQMIANSATYFFSVLISLSATESRATLRSFKRISIIFVIES